MNKIIISLFLLFSSATYCFSDEDIYRGLSNFTKVLDLIENSYIDDVDSKELTQSAIEGMLRTLDPYSNYLPPDRFKALEIDTYGEFGGIGVELTIKNGELTVIAPLENTPAFKAGIKPGDIILAIDNKLTKDMSSREALEYLRGPRNSKVSLTIKPVDGGDSKEVKLVREIIIIESVKTELINDTIAYIKLLQFQKKSSQDFIDAYKKLEKQSNSKLIGLIVDIRNNPGGLLDQAIDIADAFIDTGLIVSVKGRNPLQTKDYYANDQTSIPRMKTVVLVNKGSASASEVLAGALKDRKIGNLLGEKTFGKGSVQTIIELEDGSGVKLTTARFYTPSGNRIESLGVVPDIIIKNSEDSDLQLARAIEIINNSKNKSK